MKEGGGEFSLRAEAIAVSLGRRRVLNQVTTGFGVGELFGIIGANGSGKSTLVKSLLGLLPVDSGEVYFRDTPLRKTKRRTVAREVAYLPQNAECHWALQVERLVALGRMPFIPPWGRISAMDRQAVREAMEAVDVSHLATRPVNELSGGERLRALLARALAGQPRLLIADEPSSGLDPYHQLQMMELFRSRVEGGSSVAVVLHDLALASRFCDRILLLHEGRVLAEGAPDLVLTAENLAAAYQIEVRTLNQDTEKAILPWNRLPLSKMEIKS